MGVPAFYRWLVEKYPNVKMVAKAVNKRSDHDDVVDTTRSNPNGFEFDHLYLDMNGIIHPCFHPDTMFPPTTFEEVFENVYAYIDRLFEIVKPRKLLYLALDGVAPRAKMNQQRGRRYKTAKDKEIVEEEEMKLRVEYERQGKKLLPLVKSEVSDSNVITPGTQFMQHLSKALKSYIVDRLENHPGWKQIKVILSDATVPGEGEHKIMSLIRTLRILPGYDPNTRHCLYGQDADLIMLALATHEIHFSILREDGVIEGRQNTFSDSALTTTFKNTEQTSDKLINEEKKHTGQTLILPQHFEFLHVWILREYLELDMQILDPPEKFVFDTERIIDDFIFMCFFLGNDFLPHMPTLAIHEKGVDLLMHVYKNEFKNLGGYLVDMQRVNDQHAGYIKLKRVEKFILAVGSYEEQIFSKRTELKERSNRRFLNELAESQESGLGNMEVPSFEQQRCEIPNVPVCSEDHDRILENTKELKEELKKRVFKKSDNFKDGVGIPDKVKLGSAGWKQRYYKEKFLVEDPKETEVLRKGIVQNYTEGLCWVLMYYFSGIPSWNWFYSYHYGLFASELKGLSSAKVKFQKGSPFKPFDQLMGVLPPKSAHALPKAYQELMNDCNSKISEFYPNEFELDMDGKRYLWQGICKLPFIDQEKLLNATLLLEEKLEVNEAERNVETTDQLFRRALNRSGGMFWDYMEQQHAEKREELGRFGLEESIILFSLKLPVVSLHVPRLLEGVHIPEKTVSESDIVQTMLWHECKGRPPVIRPQSQQRYAKIATTAGHDKTDDVFRKHAGSGWAGAGRGKRIGNSSSVVYQSLQSPVDCAEHPAAVARAASNDRSIVETSTSNLTRRMENVWISPSAAKRFQGSARQYHQDNSFWRSRNSADYNQNTPQRPASYTSSSSSGVGSNGSWRSTTPSSRNSAPFTASGRGQYRPAYDVQSARPSNRW